MLSPRPLAAAATAALVLSGLAGCSGDDPQPKMASPDSSSAAGSPTPTGPAEPTLPAEAKEPTKAGAEAFVRHYWAIANFAQSTGDVETFSELGSDTCAGCRGGVDSIRRAYEAGGRMIGGDITIRKIRSSPIRVGPREAFAVLAIAEVSPQVVERPGKRATRFNGGRIKVRTIVEYTLSGWLVSRVEPL